MTDSTPKTSSRLPCASLRACPFSHKKARGTHAFPWGVAVAGWRDGGAPVFVAFDQTAALKLKKQTHRQKKEEKKRLKTLNQSLCASSLLGSTSCTTPSCVSSSSSSCNSRRFVTRSPLLESLRLHLKSKSDRLPACLALIRQVSDWSLFWTGPCSGLRRNSLPV